MAFDIPAAIDTLNKRDNKCFHIQLVMMFYYP